MIKIKESELHFSFVRSQGPGGQNVNKVSTAVQLRYNIHESDIPKHIKELFIEKYSNRISKNGDIIIIVSIFFWDITSKSYPTRDNFNMCIFIF